MHESEIRQILRHRFFRDLARMSRDTLDDASVRGKLDELLRELRRDGVKLDSDERERILLQVVNDILGYGPLQDLMLDPQVSEIMVNGPERVFVERLGKKRLASVRFDDEQHQRYTIEKMLRGGGKRLDESSPYVDLSLPDGSRINVVIPPIVADGPHLTIRKYLRSVGRLEDLMQSASLDERMARFLYACVRAKMNVLFSGATGSGKTTLLEVLGSYIDENERIVVIEDTLELRFRQPNVVRMLTRAPNIEGKGEITIRELFRNCLRMRPSRIILGEVRGGEAMDFLQALNSGHRGSLAVIHAASPEEAVIRLENLVHYSGISIPVPVIRSQIAHGLDLVVQLCQMNDGTRKVTRISEMTGLDAEGQLQLRDIFRFYEEGVGHGGEVIGSFAPTGDVPGFAHRFHLAGVVLPETTFRP